MTLWQAVAEHLATFLFGVGVGLVLSSRYRIVRLKDRDEPPA